MKKLNENEYLEYEDLGSEIEMELSIIDGYIFIDTPLDQFSINDIQLRFDGVPRNIMEYLINNRPSEIITIEELRNNAKIPTSQDLRQIIRKIGFKGFTRCFFIPVFEKDALMVNSKIKLSQAEAQLVIEQFD